MNFQVRMPDSRTTYWMIHGTGAGVLLLAAAAVYALVLAPQQATFARNENRRHSLSALMKRGPAIRREFETLQAALEEQRAKRQDFQLRLPADPQEAEFLAQVARLARSVELNVREYRPGKITPRGNYSELEIELSCEGGYPSICRFLAGLPTLPRLSSLTGVDVEAKPEQPVYPIRLKLSAYFVPMKTEERS